MYRRYVRSGNSWFICYRWRSKLITKIQIWRYRYFRYTLLRCPWFYFICAVGERHEHARSNLKRKRLFHLFVSYISTFWSFTLRKRMWSFAIFQKIFVYHDIFKLSWKYKSEFQRPLDLQICWYKSLQIYKTNLFYCHYQVPSY